MKKKGKSFICIQRPDLAGSGTDPAAPLPPRQPMIICPLLGWPERKARAGCRIKQTVSSLPPLSAFFAKIYNFSALLPKKPTGGEQRLVWGQVVVFILRAAGLVISESVSGRSVEICLEELSTSFIFLDAFALAIFETPKAGF